MPNLQVDIPAGSTRNILCTFENFDNEDSTRTRLSPQSKFVLLCQQYPKADNLPKEYPVVSLATFLGCRIPQHQTSLDFAWNIMNLALVDPFGLAQDYPEHFESSLKSGHVTCVRFNRKGDFLAAGRTDGRVVIFDMDVGSVARKLKGHTRQIQSLSWSRCGRYLLTSAQDWKVNLWDLADGVALRMVRFEGPVFTAELHPYNQ